MTIKKLTIKYNLKCKQCKGPLPKTHTTYQRELTYTRVVTEKRNVFCTKGCGTKFRPANLTKEQKAEYINKIATTRKNRTPSQKKASREKLQATFANFSQEKREDINRRTYNTKKASGVLKEASEKAIATMESRYGEDFGKQRYRKAAKTMKKRYGVANALNKESKFREKAEATMLKKYGTSNPTKSKAIVQKVRETMETRHGGVGWASSSVKAKYVETIKSKYGVDNPAKHPEVTAKFRETYKKVGAQKSWATKVKNGTTPDKVHHKGHATKKKNGSYKKNKAEAYIHEKLKELYPDIEYQTLEVEGYPFNADFYDKSSHTVFEYQGYFTHGKEPYNARKKAHREKLSELRAQSDTKWASRVTAKVWAESDPLKRKTAKRNGVNFIEWFSIKEFDEWYAAQPKRKSRKRK